MSALPWGSLPPPDLFLGGIHFVLKVKGGQRFVVFGVVGYVYIFGVWCGKWILIIVGRKLGKVWSVGIFG